MRLSSPLALFLLVLLPFFAWWGWPSSGFGRRREAIALALRLAIALGLILALAGLQVARASRMLAVVFLIDVSDSMSQAAQAAADSYVQQSLEAMGPDDQAAIVVFGAEALVEKRMSPQPAFSRIRSTLQTNATDLESAVRLGLAMYPPGAARRMVILSDGAATGSDEALQAAFRLAAASGVEIIALPLVESSGPEAALLNVEAPEHLQAGERFDLRLTVEASQPTAAEIRVLAGDRLAYTTRRELRRGRQDFSITLTAAGPDEMPAGGFVRYEVQIVPEEDGHYQNNRLAAFSQIEGPPRVLLVVPPPGDPLPGGGSRPDEAAALRQVFRQAGFEVETALPPGLPAELVDLAAYRSVVLVDVPASDLSQRQMQTLQSYVRDLGGGLLAAGGPTSFGVGGYYQTPLEETLPVQMQITDEERRPQVALVFVIDRSGSMADLSGGVSKIDLAKEATIRSIELLFLQDQVGVVAFDDSATWVAGLGEVGDPTELIHAIASIRAGGGTDILAGLQAVAERLPQDPAAVKHIILLTDGGASPAGIPELVERLNQEYGITLSTVGVGQDAADFLPTLAELGQGRYHFTADPGTIPRIFTEETSLATQAYLIEEEFVPRVVNNSPILAGIQALPPLRGYIATSPKAPARMVLVSDQDDPILATWQYGLGRVVAFTSDASGRWAQDWLGWPGFGTFWNQALRYTLRVESTGPLSIQAISAPDGRTARLFVDAETESGDYLNGYTLQASLAGPEGESQLIDLQQTGPGRYEGSFTPGPEGAYLVRVTGEAADGQAQNGPVAATTGWVNGYSAEYRQLEADPQRLAQLAVRYGGWLAEGDPAQTFRHDLQGGRAILPAWTWMLLLAAVLLPFDVAVRRLLVSPGEVRRGMAKAAIAARQRLGRPARPAQPVRRSERMDALFRAKETTQPGEESDDRTKQPTGQFRQQPGRHETGPEPQEFPRKSAETGEGGASEEGSTAARLLDAKRRRKDSN